MTAAANDIEARRLSAIGSRGRSLVKRNGKDAPGVASPALFDLAIAKLKVSKTINETAPGQFKHFFASPLFDRLVTPCLLYFLDTLQACTLSQAMDKAQRQHLDNVRIEATEERQRELAKTADQALHALAPIYSLVVLNHSTYKQTHRDQLFFEAVYSGLAAVIHEALGSFKTRQEVDVEVGDLFRTRAFNFHARKAAPPRSLDTLTLRELYALKTETTNRALSAKMLADIYKKLENIHVQSTCRINTPLITKCLQSPIVSKNAALAKHHQTAPQQALTKSLSSSIPGTTQPAISSPGLAKMASKKATKASGAGGSSTSALPVWVDPNGMATDDSIVQLDTLRDVLNGKRIVTAGSLRSERSTASVMSRPSLSGTARAMSSAMGSQKGSS